MALEYLSDHPFHLCRIHGIAAESSHIQAPVPEAGGHLLAELSSAGGNEDTRPKFSEGFCKGHTEVCSTAGDDGCPSAEVEKFMDGPLT